MEKCKSKDQIYIRNIIRFILFVFIGNVVYKTLIIDELPNPDAIWNGLIYKDNWRWECSLGRYMIRVFQMFFDYIINPAAVTMLSVVCLAVICVIVINIFSLEKYSAVLCGCVILLTPAITGTLSYYYCSVYYMIAYLFAVLAAYIMCKEMKIVWGVGASILICLSLATYQAYIGCTVVIVLLYLIVQAIDNGCEWGEWIKRFFYTVVIFLAGVFLYLVTNKLIQYIWQVSAESGRGFSNIGHISLEKIPELLKNTYIYFYQYFFTADMINNFSGVICKRNINIVFMFCILLIVIGKLVFCKKNIYFKIIVIIGMLVLPIAVMCITIAAPEVSIYDSTGMLMLPTTNYVYILPLILLNGITQNRSKYIRIGIYAVLLLIITTLFNYSSAMQVYQKTCLRKMHYVASNIAEELEKYLYDGKKYEVCVIGSMESGNYPELYPELAEMVQWTTASYGTVWNDYSGRQACWREYIKGYLGINFDSCNLEKYNEILSENQYKEAPCFPMEGSVFIYNDSVVVIKLS